MFVCMHITNRCYMQQHQRKTETTETKICSSAQTMSRLAAKSNRQRQTIANIRPQLNERTGVAAIFRRNQAATPATPTNTHTHTDGATRAYTIHTFTKFQFIAQQGTLRCSPLLYSTLHSFYSILGLLLLLGVFLFFVFFLLLLPTQITV